jgi:beta-phosphoglucomutase-like phosphatase (HAD superfamily)
LKACIFDLDGTLLDSMKVWHQIDADFLHARGFAVPPDYSATVAPLSIREVAKYTIKRFCLSEDPDSLIAEWKAMAAHAYSHTIPMKPYAGEYLHTLKACGHKLAVATSLSASLYIPALQRLGIMSLFDAHCSVDEVVHGKSRPDIYLLAAQRLETETRLCVVYEDIPQAIRSAKQAGMTVYGVYDDASKEHWETIKKISDGVICNYRNAPIPNNLI